MLKENNYIELGFLMKRLFEKHFKKGKYTFEYKDVLNEVYGKKIPIDTNTLGDITRSLKENSISFKFVDRQKIETKNGGNYPLKIVITLDEEHLAKNINYLIHNFHMSEIDFNLEINLYNQRSNLGIRVKDNIDLKKVTQIIRNKINSDHLKPNLPYIPTYYDVGYVLEKNKDDFTYEELMNKYLYNHVSFAMKRKQLELCNPDFIIRSLEIRLSEENNLRNQMVLYHLKLLKEYGNKESEIGKIRK